MLDNAFIVNTGELLRHWSNDRFISVKHFANNNTGTSSRYSIPYFLNAECGLCDELHSELLQPRQSSEIPTNFLRAKPGGGTGRINWLYGYKHLRSEQNRYVSSKHDRTRDIRTKKLCSVLPFASAQG